MLQIQRVVHPTDFSDDARAAFAHALYLARRHGATLDVVHAAPLLGDLPPGPGIGVAFYPEGYEDRYCADQEGALRSYVQEAATAGLVVNVVPPLFGGAPAREILGYVQRTDADLIVMGTHGRHGLRRLVLGSVAEAVVRRASCPVLTVRARPEGAPHPDQIRCILAAVELAYYAEEVVRYAGALASLYPAAVVLLHVVDGVTDPQGERPERRPGALESEALHRLEQLRLLVTDPAVPVSCHVSSGFTLEAVPHAIARLAPDLVVTASHGFRGFDRLLLGSVAERIVRQGPGATLVVKPTGRSLLPPVPVRASPPAASMA